MKKLILSLFLATYALPSIAFAQYYEGSIVKLYDYLHFHFADSDGDGRLSKEEFENFKEMHYGNDIPSDSFINEYNDDFFFPNGQNYINAPDFFDAMYKVSYDHLEEAFEATFNMLYYTASDGLVDDQGPYLAPYQMVQALDNILQAAVYGSGADSTDLRDMYEGFIQELKDHIDELGVENFHLGDFMFFYEDPYFGYFSYVDYLGMELDDYYDNLDYDYDDPVDPVDPDPVDPVDPVDPDPVDPVDPDPVDPVDPDPVDPVNPVDPEPSSEPIQEPEPAPATPSANTDIKRIYTVDQAVAAVKNNKNTFSIKYR